VYENFSLRNFLYPVTFLGGNTRLSNLLSNAHNILLVRAGREREQEFTPTQNYRSKELDKDYSDVTIEVAATVSGLSLFVLATLKFQALL
jgi:hypothetical protein